MPTTESRKTKSAGIKAIFSISWWKTFLLRPLILNSLFLITEYAVTSLGGFVFWIAAARLYSTTEIGLASAVFSAINLLVLLSMFGQNFTIIRFLPEVKSPVKFTNSGLTIVSLISLITSVIFIAGIKFWSPALAEVQNNIFLLLLFIVITVLFTISNVIDTLLTAGRKVPYLILKNAVLGILKLAGLGILVFLVNDYGIIASWGIAFVIVTIISIYWLIPKSIPGFKPRPGIDIEQIKSTGVYSSGSYAASLLSRLPGMIFPLIVVNALGTEENAYFYIAWTVSYFLTMISHSISRSFFVESAYKQNAIRKNVKRTLFFNAVVTIITAAVMMAAGRWILLAFGEAYSASGLHLYWLLCLANLARGTSQIYISFLRIRDRIKEMILIHLFPTLAGLILSFFTVRSYGIMSIGYIWLIIQVSLSLVLMIKLLTWVKHR